MVRIAVPRILLCCPTPVTSTLGASKVYIEVAEGFRRIGWDVTLVGPDEVAGRPVADPVFDQPPYLRAYLRDRAAEFDVVEYEHHALPYSRSDFPPGPLFVARSVLLAHSQMEARIPHVPSLRGWAGHLLRGHRRRINLTRVVRQADLTIGSADLANVSNDDDGALLVRRGHQAGKVRVFPFGLFPERLAAFSPEQFAIPDPPVVAFIGTFDPRKGMIEFPRLVAEVLREFPKSRFRLLGTAGLIPDAGGVMKAFPATARGNLDIVPRFAPEQLPELLSGCSLGVFPSHVEGFAFGVLEMLAAGLPVVAFDAPGPPMMLASTFLVRRGDASAMARRVTGLLADPVALRAARARARERAADFDWERVAAETAEAYMTRVAGRGGTVR